LICGQQHPDQGGQFTGKTFSAFSDGRRDLVKQNFNARGSVAGRSLPAGVAKKSPARRQPHRKRE
jgi:hypothetical protein